MGDFFTSRREKGKANLPILSVTLHDGLVNRDDLDRKMETNLSPDKHLLIKKGDLAYNMMRMWQGANGLCEADGIVSPAYVVLSPRKNMDSGYASYLFKTPRMVYLFWAYSYGLTKDRLRLYHNDFRKIPVEVPDKEEQIKIAQILSRWDRAIETVEALIANAQQQKSGLMRHLLSYEGQDITSGTKEYSLGDLGFTYNGLSGKNKNDFGAGKPYIPYINVYKNQRINIHDLELVHITDEEKQNEVKYGDIIFTTSSETAKEVGFSSVLLDCIDETYLNSFCFGFRLKNFNILLPEFAQFYLRSEFVRRQIFSIAQGTTRYNLSKAYLKKIKLLLPDIEEQRKIAKTLNNQSQKMSILKKQLKCLKKEKSALMQQLLTGKRRVSAK